jgi:hypothetical protein
LCGWYSTSGKCSGDSRGIALIAQGLKSLHLVPLPYDFSPSLL